VREKEKKKKGGGERRKLHPGFLRPTFLPRGGREDHSSGIASDSGSDIDALRLVEEGKPARRNRRNPTRSLDFLAKMETGTADRMRLR